MTIWPSRFLSARSDLAANILRHSWLVCLLLFLALADTTSARVPDRILDVWSDLAPGETTRNVGEALARRPAEQPPATRVTAITFPQLAIFEPPQELRNGVVVLILPGGGYNYVVADKEGSEAAEWLTRFGITGAVLHYRTKNGDAAPWRRPVQDGQRAIRLLRAKSNELGLDANKIGIMGFSAGGQAAAIVSTAFEKPLYDSQDGVDEQSCRPDFSMLIYPGKLFEEESGALIDALDVGANTPPTFLVHAHNDSVTSLSSVHYYAALRQYDVSGELHILQSGGHGYGMRTVEGSNIHNWPDRAADWLEERGLSGTGQARLKFATIDGIGPGWRALGESDFVNVNCDTDTWSWRDGVAYCTGSPVGVIRTKTEFTNFELVCEWKHKKKGGNSGVFVWAMPASIERLAAGKGRLPEGIEVQVLDLGYAELYQASTGKPADWFTSHGDVFPVGSASMQPFPPVAPNGKRSFPTKRLTKGLYHWNHYYVRAVNGEVRLWVNGEEVSGGTQCQPATGYLCLESEGAPVEFRNIRIRELP